MARYVDNKASSHHPVVLVAHLDPGCLGTDQYPPFTLGLARGCSATMDIACPATLSSGLVQVKWWLLAIPHYLIFSLFVSNWWGWIGPAIPPAPEPAATWTGA